MSTSFAPVNPTDRVDQRLERWSAARPDLDFTPLDVGMRVLRAAHLLQARLDSIAAAYGLSHQGDLEVLTELDLTGPLTPSKLAANLLLTSGGMTVRLNRLQGAGLLERHPNPQDGRGVLVHLMPKGRDLANHALPTLLDAQTAVFGVLRRVDRANLARLLRSLLVELGDAPEYRPPISVTREP